MTKEIVIFNLQGEVGKQSFRTKAKNNGLPDNICMIHDDGLLQEVDPRAAVSRQGKLLPVKVDLHSGVI